MSESLRQLLQNADRTPVTSNTTETASRVRKRYANERRVRRQMVSVATVIVVGAIVVLWPRNTRQVVTAPSVDDRAVLAALDVDARVHAATAEALTMSNRAHRANRARETEVDPITQVQFQRDRAAMTLVYEAERFEAQPQLGDRAVAQYRKVIELFPNSSWASVARQRLRDLTS